MFSPSNRIFMALALVIQCDELDGLSFNPEGYILTAGSL
jgi:hypothetical protein